MANLLVWLASLFLMLMSMVANADSITLYESPAVNSKVVATVTQGQLLIPFFQQKDWVKVANPKNGDVGWTPKANLGQTSVLTVTEPSPGVQQYTITQKSKDGSSISTYRSQTFTTMPSVVIIQQAPPADKNAKSK